jgi:hypothetical protein
MIHSSCPYHVQIDIDKAAAQLFAGLYGSRMVAIFPESPFAVLSLVIFLTDATRYQLNGWSYGFGLVMVFHKQMDMIGGNRIVQDLHGKPGASFAQPAYKTMPVMSEFQ